MEAPKLDIYDFKAVLKYEDEKEAISIENTLWANTYVAAGTVTAVVVYTGRECRSALNSREQRQKMGRLDRELNFLSKILFLFMCSLALLILLNSPQQPNDINILY